MRREEFTEQIKRETMKRKGTGVNQGGKGRKRKRGHFEISEEHLPFGVPLIDLLVQDGYHEN